MVAILTRGRWANWFRPVIRLWTHKSQLSPCPHSVREDFGKHKIWSCDFTAYVQFQLKSIKFLRGLLMCILLFLQVRLKDELNLAGKKNSIDAIWIDSSKLIIICNSKIVNVCVLMSLYAPRSFQFVRVSKFYMSSIICRYRRTSKVEWD